MWRHFLAFLTITLLADSLSAQTQIPDSALSDASAFRDFFSLHGLREPFMALYTEAGDCGFCMQNLQVAIETVLKKEIPYRLILIVRASNPRSARLIAQTHKLDAELYFTVGGALRTLHGIRNTPAFLFVGHDGALKHAIPLQSIDEFMDWINGHAAEREATAMSSPVSTQEQSNTTVRIDTVYLRDNEGSYPFYLRSRVHVMEGSGLIVTYDQKLHMLSVFDSAGYYLASHDFKTLLPDSTAGWLFYPSLGSDGDSTVFLVYDNPADTTQSAILIMFRLADASYSRHFLTGNGAILALNDVVLPGGTDEEIVIGVMPRPIDGVSVVTGKDIVRAYSMSGSVRASADLSGYVNTACIEKNQTQRPLIDKIGDSYYVMQTFSDTMFVLDAGLVPIRALPLGVPAGFVSWASDARDNEPCVHSHRNIALMRLSDGSLLVQRRRLNVDGDIRHARFFTGYDPEGRYLFSGQIDLVFLSASTSGVAYAIDPDASDTLFRITFQPPR